MAEQSRGDQRKIIERAQKQGELDNLYWYVSFDLPLKFGSLLKPKTSAGAKHRGGVPVIPTGPDQTPAQQRLSCFAGTSKTTIVGAA